MTHIVAGVTTVLGRVLLSVIFFMSAVGNKIPQFNEVAGLMKLEGVPAPQLMLVGAIAFLIAGSVSVIVGYQARIGAALLLIFLILASYFVDPELHQKPLVFGVMDAFSCGRICQVFGLRSSIPCNFLP